MSPVCLLRHPAVAYLFLVRPRKTMCPCLTRLRSIVDTGALFLRHLTLDDTAVMLRLSQEQGIRAWIPNQVYADEAQALEVLRFLSSQYSPSANPRHTPYVLGVCLSASHELIGQVGFSPCEYGVEVGY